MSAAPHLRDVGVAFVGDGSTWIAAGPIAATLGPGELERLLDDDPSGGSLRSRLAPPAGTPPPVELPLEIGDYRVTGLLGRGGFGTVVTARDRVSGERVALKVLREVDPWALQSFKNEARSLADIFDERLVAPDELIEFGGRLALVMRLVEGRDFRSVLAEAAGRAGPLRDPSRVAGLCVRLLRAVAALHATGLVHMDLKPGNVLVGDDDEVRLLDFGLSRLRGCAAPGDDLGVSGTPLYMAPEQLLGAPPAPAMDVYAIGVMLHEGLTGATPFERVAHDPVFARLYAAPATAASRRPDLAPMWCAVLDELVAREPAARPGLAALLERLADADPPAPAAASAPWVGREAELERLAGVWSEVRSGGVALCLVAGDPGAGKTELARHFAAGVRAGDDAVVAWARCRPRESISFKALDPVIDRLCALIHGDPALRAEVAARPETTTLRRVFSAFAALLDAPDDAVADPPDRPAIAAALGRVLGVVGARVPVLLVIDDAHWGDADSVDLLVRLLAEGHAARLMVLLTHRAADWDEVPFARALADRVGKGVPFGITRLRVDALPPALARGLVAARLGLAADAPEVARVVEAAAGSPFLLDQYVCSVRAGDPLSPLPALLARRLARWPAEVRAFVRAAATAGSATAVTALARAAGVPVPTRGTLAALAAAGLLRPADAAGQRAVVCFHDLVRDALWAELPAETRARLHRGLADALAASGDPGAVAWHFAQAGARAEAAAWALRGAAEAELAKAHARAVELWSLALAVGADDRRGVRRRLAGALQADGRGLAAADTYVELARDAPPAEARTLLRRAAEAAMLAGETRRGLELLVPVLHALGLPPPARGPSGAGRLLTGVLWLVSHGWHLRPGARPDPVEAEHSDTCWVAARGLVFIDPLPGLDFLIRALRHGARSGSPRRLGRAMGVLAAGLLAQAPGLARLAARWLDALRAWGERDDYLHAVAPLWSSLHAFGRGELTRALELARTALDRTAGIEDAAWERVQAAALVGRTLRSQGQYVACIELGRAHLLDAERRGDRYAQMLFGDVQVLPLIAAGAAPEADARIRWLADHWLPDRYTVQSFYVMLHRAYAALYAGRPDEAGALLVRQRGDFRRAGGYRIVYSRLDHNLLELRISAALRERRVAGLLSFDELLARVQAEALPEALGNAALLRGVAAGRAGGRALALAELARAIHWFDRAGIAMEAAAARLRRAELLGDRVDEGEALVQMRRLGAHAPRRWAEVVAPGP